MWVWQGKGDTPTLKSGGKVLMNHRLWEFLLLCTAILINKSAAGSGNSPHFEADVIHVSRLAISLLMISTTLIFTLVFIFLSWFTENKGVSIDGGTPKWMVSWKDILKKWMVTPHFPNRVTSFFLISPLPPLWRPAGRRQGRIIGHHRIVETIGFLELTTCLPICL